MPLFCKGFIVTDPTSEQPTYTRIKVQKPLKFGSRCQLCKKKIPVGCSTACRCGLTNLCSDHRLPEDHSCSFDYKKLFACPEALKFARVAII